MDGAEYWQPNTTNTFLRAGRRERDKKLNRIGDIGRLSPEIEEEYPIWRLWKETGTSLKELRTERFGGIGDSLIDIGTKAFKGILTFIAEVIIWVFNLKMDLEELGVTGAVWAIYSRACLVSSGIL